MNHSISGWSTLPLQDNYNRSFENETYLSFPQYDGVGIFSVIEFSILVLIIPFTLIGNILVLVAVVRFRRLRTCMNILIMNLAISDLLVGCPTGPLYASIYIYPDLAGNKWLCLLKCASVTLSFSCSLISLCFISIERYLVVFFPLHYNTWVTKRRIKIAIVALWCYAILLSVMPLLGVNTWNQAHTCEYYDLMPKEFTITGFVVTIGICFPTSAVIFVRITCEIKKVRKRVMNSTYGHYQRQRHREDREKRAGAMMAFIFLLFVVFWLPFAVAIPLKYVFTIQNMVSNVKNLTVVIAMGNSVVNPIVYCWCKEELRTAFMAILCCRRQQRVPDTRTFRRKSQALDKNSKTGDIFSVL